MRGIFIKFGQKEHLEEMLEEGNLYCNTLDYFKICDNKEQKDINEKNYEIIKYIKSTCIQTKNSKNFSFEIQLPVIKEYSNIFCLYTIDMDKTVRKDNKVFAPRLNTFGEYMLIIKDISPFIDNLNEKLQQAQKDKSITYAKAQQVNYIKSESGIEYDIFNKSIEYEHQNEWRLAIKVPQNNSKPYKLSIGSMKNYAEIISCEQCKNALVPNGNGNFTANL